MILTSPTSRTASNKFGAYLRDSIRLNFALAAQSYARDVLIGDPRYCEEVAASEWCLVHGKCQDASIDMCCYVIKGRMILCLKRSMLLGY